MNATRVCAGAAGCYHHIWASGCFRVATEKFGATAIGAEPLPSRPARRAQPSDSAQTVRLGIRGRSANSGCAVNCSAGQPTTVPLQLQ